MEDLINLKEYAAKYHISWHICKKWIEKGLKHIGTRPYLTKEVWINEFLENYSETNNKNVKVSVSKPKRTMNCKKIDINNYL